MARPGTPRHATAPRVHHLETIPPGVIDVLRVIERAAASWSPENAIVFGSSPPPSVAGGEVCALRWMDVELDEETPRVVIRRASSISKANGPGC
ncbi:MAG: hypothetical protein M3326_07365 [Actinomycetota bacterium]|nr:hypothetical protein [Actinomycetota bacterium]